MNYELRQYSFGQTIGKGFNLYFDNFIPVVLVSLVCQIPLMLVLGFGDFLKVSDYSAVDIMGYFGNLLFIMFWSFISQGIVSAYVIQLTAKRFLENSPTGGDNSLTSIFPIILPVIGVTFTVGMATVFGFMVCIIPGIIIMLGFGLATEVLVIERRKVGESMTRSWILTQGRKGTVFLITMVASIIVIGITQAVLLLLRLTALDREIVSYLEYLITAIVSPVNSCIFVVLYFNLRIEKEGFNIEHLVRQFTLADSVNATDAAEPPPEY